MTGLRLLDDIRNQPRSLGTVLDHHSVGGRAALLAASALIRQTGNVVITGMGASFNAATPFYYSLAGAGFRASLIETAELLHFLRPLCRDSVVIIVSRSGESVEAVKLQDALKAADVKIVAVTNDASSTLARGATVHVLIGSMADEIVAIQSYTGTVLALHLLAAEVLGGFHAAASVVFSAIRQMPALVEQYEHDSAAWRDFLEPGVPIYSLGRGHSVASAQETALLFGETAKQPAVGLAAGTFRHGPVEVVDARYRAIVFAPAGPSRELNLALARELSRLGGQVRVAGPAAGGGAFTCWQTPEYPEDLAPLFEIVPAQFAAMRLAEWSGIRPGVFRNTGQVTRDEVAF